MLQAAIILQAKSLKHEIISHHSNSPKPARDRKGKVLHKMSSCILPFKEMLIVNEAISASWVSKFPSVSTPQTEEKASKDRIKVSVCVHITNIPNINKMSVRKARNKDNKEMVNNVEVWSPVSWVPVPWS